LIQQDQDHLFFEGQDRFFFKDHQIINPRHQKTVTYKKNQARTGIKDYITDVNIKFLEETLIVTKFFPVYYR